MRLLATLILIVMLFASQAPAEGVRVAIVRLTHDHVFWLLSRPRDQGDIEIVGVYEPNETLLKKVASEHDLAPNLCFTDLETMLLDTKPEAVCLFGSTAEHHDQTLICLEQGSHVMVEKPLALDFDQAGAMSKAAQKAGLELLTNYETTWYANNREIKRIVTTKEHGPIRRMVFRTGHRGPIEIGCREVFLDWLLDPKQNGGGAITDFGCYGANVSTWLMEQQRPVAVTALTQQLKPDLYSKVDDDSTILIEYPNATAVVQASWNWPLNVKDLNLSCEKAELITQGQHQLSVKPRESVPTKLDLQPLEGVDLDPFAHLAAVVRGESTPHPLCSIENNLIVMEILDAARRSAKTGKRVVLE